MLGLAYRLNYKTYELENLQEGDSSYQNHEFTITIF